jgi:hypothetical protein
VIATVQDHQRYFAVEGADGKLSGWFVTVSNIESRDPSKVREGQRAGGAAAFERCRVLLGAGSQRFRSRRTRLD